MRNPIRTSAWRRFATPILAPLALVLPLLVVSIATAPSASAGCAAVRVTTAGDYGTQFNGGWHNSYDAYCDNSTDGSFTADWETWVASDGHRMIRYDFSVTADNIAGPAGSRCIQVAFDWAGQFSASTHEDMQIMRNCNDHSTRVMDSQTHDVDKYCQAANWCATGAWPVGRITVAVYRSDISGGSIAQRLCPADFDGMGSDTLTGCGNFSPNGDFSTKAAKIRSSSAAQGLTQNTPTYPGEYDIQTVVQDNV